ncbi:MAG: hypothetical protein WCG94_00820 [Methanothrix sp.]
MRLLSILLFAISLSYLSYQTCAIEPGDIAAPSIGAPDMSMPNPVPIPNMNTPEPRAVGPANNPIKATNKTSNMSSEQQELKTMDVSGKWSIKFSNQPGASLDLTLWSSGGNKIMGYGTLTKGGAGNSVTASGSFIEKELILAVKSAEPEYSSKKYDEYDLDLVMANDTLSGTYTLSSGGEFVGDGNAMTLKR